MPYFMRISSASISPRGITGTLAAWAATTSGLSPLTAEEMTTTWAPSMASPWWPRCTVMPRPAQALGDGALLQIRAGYLVAQVGEHLGDARHADAADAHEMDVLDLAEHLEAPMFSRRQNNPGTGMALA